jgi:hypothetical protein
LPIETIKEAEKIQHLVGPQYLLPWSVKMHWLSILSLRGNF